MRNLWSFLALFLLGIETSIAQVNSVRIAYFANGNDIPPDFLQRSKSAGYNYILAPFPNLAPLSALRISVRDATTRVNSYGMRLIPLISTGSQYCENWVQLRSLYPNMQMNIDYNANTSPPSFRYSTQMAPDAPGVSNGMDAAFHDVMVAVNEGFNDAKNAIGFSYDLEYIHLGHDEPVSDVGLVTGNTMNNGGTIGNQYSPGEFSVADLDYLINNGGVSSSESYQRLFVDEIWRRVSTIKSVISPATKVIIYADFWDPEANGGGKQKTNGGEIVMVDPTGGDNQGIASLPHPTLTTPQKDELRNALILMPWCYYQSWGFGVGDPTMDGDYDTRKTFNYFSSNGFKFIYMSSISDGVDAKGYEGPITIEKFNAIKEYATTSKLFRSNSIGYAAAAWADWNPSNSMFNQYLSYQIIEWLPEFAHPYISSYTTSAY